MGLGEKIEFTHAASTIVWHVVSFNHTCSNLHSLWFLVGIPSNWIRSGLWSEKIASKWMTTKPGNRESHFEFTTALSKCSQTVIPPASFLHQVYFTPLYPKSARQQTSKASLNSFIWFSGLALPPNFSCDFAISLKSSAHNHGKEEVLLRFF